jgi:hypothetical protein
MPSECPELDEAMDLLAEGTVEGFTVRDDRGGSGTWTVEMLP